MRDQFPILENCLYLNTAYTAPLSKGLSQWRLADDLAFEKKGDGYKTQIEKTYFNEARSALAYFADAEQPTTFITSNFSTAFQNFLLFFPRDTRFLVLEDEYPSLTGIIDDLGFSSHRLTLSSIIEEKVWEALHNNSYEVFALSVIQYTSGLYFSFAWLEKIKKSFPALIILVDGTQFLGAELFSLQQSPVDAIFGSTYKWLFAGYGSGYAAIKSSLLTQLNLDVNRLANAYDRGHLSIKAVGSLAFSLQQIMAADFPSLIEYKQQLSSQMFVALKERNLLCKITAQRAQHSSIFNLQVNEKIYQGLLGKNVRCVQRGEGVRIALHYYNNQQDVTTFLQIIDALL